MNELDGDIALGSAAISTPIGMMLFTVSFTTSVLAGEDGRNYVAIAHHPDSGVMTIGNSGKEKGEPAYRLACANAAALLWRAVQHNTTNKRIYEATRYEH
jgi:hypothetical protein